MNRLTVIGCGTVVPEPDRGCSSFLVELEGSRVLLDCGPGAVQAMARLGVAWQEISDLAITHFHADHVGALPGLFFSFTHGIEPRRERPLHVWGPPGTVDLFEGLAAALGGFMLDPGFPVHLHEITEATTERLDSGVRLEVSPTPHTEESVAIRLDSGAASFGYSGDTGPSGSLGMFVADTDVFVCECSLSDEQVGDNHLSPAGVASIAEAARPGTLVLSHVYPHFRASADVPALVRDAGYDGRTVLAHEGLEIPLPGETTAPSEGV